MADGRFSIGRVILQIAVGLMLSVAGIWALQGGGDAASSAIKGIFAGDVRNILVIVFAVIEIIAGILLIVGLFVPNSMASFNKILLLIIIIVWIVAIVLIDFLGNGGIFHSGSRNFLSWLYQFANHLIVLGALIVLQNS